MSAHPRATTIGRLSLGLDADAFAAQGGVSAEELKHYEFADTEEISDPTVAERVGRTLELLEANIEPKVDNGAVPHREDTDARTYAVLQSSQLGQRLALTDIDSTRQIIESELVAIDPAARLVSLGERARGPMRELLVEWSDRNGAAHDEASSSRCNPSCARISHGDSARATTGHADGPCH